MSAETLQVGGFALALRDASANDRAAVLALHTLVFGPDVDERWFDWKYGQAAQQGQGQAVGLWHGGELIAFCGGLPRTLWQQAQSRRAMQIGDVMVHPAWRGILRRHGPFFQVSKRFYDSQLGAAPGRPFQIGFGFPNARHLRLAVVLGLLQRSGAMESLHWSAAQAPAAALPWHWRWHELPATDARWERTAEAAWRAMRSHSAGLTLGERGAGYLRWRYANRPPAPGAPAGASARYRFFGLRRAWSPRCAGIAVLDLRSSSARWLDWIGPLAWLPMASQACRREAARAGATELTAWASAAVAEQLAHSGITQREVCAEIGIPSASDLEPHEVSGLRWWLMGGDTDFL